MSGKVTISLSAKQLLDLYEKYPEVEVEIAKGTVANVAQWLAAKAMDHIDTNMSKIVKKAQVEADKLMASQFEKVSGTRWNPVVKLTDAQSRAVKDSINDQIMAIANKMLSEKEIEKIIKERAEAIAEKHLWGSINDWMKKNLGPMVDSRVERSLQKKLGIGGKK